jgi:hypothetical protein
MKKSIVLCFIILLLGGYTYAQEKFSMNVNDLDKHSEKYIKGHYENYKIVEAFKYEVTYLIIIQRGDSTESLVFDRDGKFVYKSNTDFAKKMALQPKSTMSVGDVKKDIDKYVSKNYEDFKITQAHKYDLVYTAKLAKDAEEITLLFNADGNFVNKVDPEAKPAPATAAKPADAPAPAPAKQMEAAKPVEPAAKPAEKPTETGKKE